MAPETSSIQSSNGLLSGLSRSDARLLKPHLENVDLPLRKRLEVPNRRIDAVYFIEGGIASVVAGGSGERGIEVGVIGHEGMTGLAILMGSDRSPHDTFMQVAGSGKFMRASNLRKQMAASTTMREGFLKYGYAFHIQTSHTALANGRSKIEDRLARWLLMAADRVPAEELRVTHEFLSMMLGVRRAGVTLALHLLEKRGLIESTRGAIRIVDRGGLEKSSNGTYGVAEAEYRRLCG